MAVRFGMTMLSITAYWYSILFTQVLGAFSYQNQKPQLETSEIDILKARLRAKDTTRGSVLLRYTSLQYLPDHLRVTGCPIRENGWWYSSGEMRAAIAFTGCERETPQYQLAIWDGIQYSWFRTHATWEAADPLGFVPNVFAHVHLAERIDRGLLTHMYLPDYLGLAYANTFWSSYLDQYSKVAVVGRERIAGRDCVAIVGDMSKNEAFTYPWKICFDDRDSLLALRVQSFWSGADLPTRTRQELLARGRCLDIGGTTWVEQSRIEVDTVAELRDGTSIGSHGTVTISDDRGIYMEVYVDLQESCLNGARPSFAVRPDIPDGTLVTDARTGTEYYHNRDNDPDYPLNLAFYSSLKSASAHIAEDWKRATDLHEIFTDASTRATSLYTFLLLSGVPVPLADVNRAVATERTSQRTSYLDNLVFDCKALGYRGVAHEVQDCVTMPPGTWIAIETRAQKRRPIELEFAQVINREEAIVLQPFRAARRVSIEELGTRAEGLVYTLGGKDESGQSSAGAPFALVGLLAVIGALGVSIALQMRRVRRKRPDNHSARES